METIELDKEHVRVLGIDPSTSHMGVSILNVNIVRPDKFQLIYSNTIHGDRVDYNPPKSLADNGGPLSRINGLARALDKIITLYAPSVVICEDNFRGPSTSTFKTLIEVVCSLRNVVLQHELDLHMCTVLPNLAKATVNANFKGTTKDDVSKGIAKYKNLDLGDINLDDLDEHSTDSLAIALYLCEKIAKDYGVFNEDV